ncbi:hypothetical protein M378DRAFT_655859 [Amanita muscaria Koide BX008]|uniref:Protein kinase domain-containing protein n=1 Tax=Amanita muscaria (strain Koide BX008) TaxID=946122 RepID=A0A0C2WPY2_AMAMK|nr:hypothetical protein M378DRAFT_655859 [Amanita muscaria Koide BX008]
MFNIAHEETACIIKAKEQEFNTALKAKEHIFEVKEQGFNAVLEAKERIIEANEHIIEAKEERFNIVLEGKERRFNIVLANKESMITMLQNQVAKSKGLPIGLGWRYLKGSHAHTQEWQRLTLLNRVRKGAPIPAQTPKNTLQDVLLKNSHTWSRESDLYEDIANVMKSLYHDKLKTSSTGNRLSVQAPFNNAHISADIDVTSQSDKALLNTMLYFVDLKGFSSSNFKADDHGCQILDQFDALYDAQQNRFDFVAVLSNGKSSWVFEACYDESDITIIQRPANDLADAIMHADALSRKQYNQNCIPALDEECFASKAVIALREKHTLLSVERLQGKIKEGAEWQNPFGSRTGSKVFVLKATSPRGSSLANEIRILEKIRSKLFENQNFLHVPQLVWKADNQLGIMPCGRPVDLDNGEPAYISRRIVKGLMDGLQFLHAMNIIHRDIRPSNLVLFGADDKCHVVIIDYENAVDNNQKTSYEGGMICLPRHLLQHHLERGGHVPRFGAPIESSDSYTPRKQDDLHAAILVVLQILFFRWFRQFPVWLVEKDPKRTQDVCDLWDNIERSAIWKPFLQAVQAMDDDVYEKLKKMGDVFCALPPVTI